MQNLFLKFISAMAYIILFPYIPVSFRSIMQLHFYKLYLK